MMPDDLSSRSLGLIVVEVSFLITLNIFSLIGNALVCISVYKNTRLRTTTNLYIIALAISDLLSAVFVMPVSTSVLIAGNWILGETLCQLHAFFSLFVIYVSPVTMAFTAVNRYVRICRSDQQYRRLFSGRKPSTWLVSAWAFVACYAAVPRLLGLQAYEFVSGYAQCSIAHLSETGKIINYGIVVTLFFLTPLIATTFSYTKVAKMIRQHNASAFTTIQRQESARERSRKWRKSKGITNHEIKISKSLFAVVFAFMICWVPFWIIVILRRFRLVAVMPRNVELFCMFLFYLSNAINPFIYAGMNPVFRREFRKILLCNHCHEVDVADDRRARMEDVPETPNMEFSQCVRRPNFHHDTSLVSLSVEMSENCGKRPMDLGLGPSISQSTC
ncbi:octopamine receptor 1-like [Stylophora pistillata]|uniref:octopamine receptor 1-like n=1 Tax=Stylophora pistillata TaxID=50429 RepID=UPI000C045713|nr:octopamine receptor 1-like [Stylophora pistillata]